MLDDLAVLDRERVERAGEFVLRQQQRRRAAGACHAATRAAHASRSSAVIVRTSARHGAGLVARLAVGDERLKPLAEDVLEIVERDGERTAV